MIRAGAAGLVSADDALFGVLRRFKADYRVIPRATFTAPKWPVWVSPEPRPAKRASPSRSRAMIWPGWTEANKAAAGPWHRAHVNPRLLAIARRFHDRRRG